MSMMNSMSRMRGQEKGPGYTQTEAVLGESMQKFGRELGEDSSFGEPFSDHHTHTSFNPPHKKETGSCDRLYF